MALDIKNLADNYSFWHEISKDDYYSAKKELDKSVFNKSYRARENEEGNAYIYEHLSTPSEDEINTALLVNLLDKQMETNDLLSSIKGMLKFFTILTIIGLVGGFLIAIGVI